MLDGSQCKEQLMVTAQKGRCLEGGLGAQLGSELPKAVKALERIHEHLGVVSAFVVGLGTFLPNTEDGLGSAAGASTEVASSCEKLGQHAAVSFGNARMATNFNATAESAFTAAAKYIDARAGLNDKTRTAAAGLGRTVLAMQDMLSRATSVADDLQKSMGLVADSMRLGNYCLDEASTALREALSNPSST